MWKRLSERARRVVYFALENAMDRSETYVCPDHLLSALLQENGCVGATVLDRLGVSRILLHADLELQRPCLRRHRRVDFGAEAAARRAIDLDLETCSLDAAAKRAINLAYKDMKRLRHSTLGTGHLLLGLIREGENVACRVLQQHGVDWERARSQVTELQDDEPYSPPAGDGRVDRTQRVLRRAQEDAEARNENYAGPEHLQRALLQDEESVGARVLDRLGVSRSRLDADLSQRRSALPRHAGEDIRFTRSSRWAFDLGAEEARMWRHEHFTTGHLLLGLLLEGKSLSCQLLIEHGVDLARARAAVAELYEDELLPDQAEEEPGAGSAGEESADH
jgi:ATP-dependent Clp protease ATP-binding subunit ClpA